MQARVVIAGGGPSAAALAVELNRLGLPCAVIARLRPRLCFEGMSERTAALLERSGLHQARASLRRPGPRHAFWNGTGNRHNSEYLVERRALDRALLADLRDQGIAVVETACRGYQRQGDHWLINTDSGPWRAEFLVEARGRAAPAGEGTDFRGPPTVAIARLFTSEACADATAIWPFADGWAWMARGSDGIASVQFTIDGESVGAGGKAALTRLHQEMAMRLESVADWLAPGAKPRGEAFARDCTAYLRSQVAGANYLRVGDGACGLDPLSGQGVFLALAGALSAAAVVNTCVNRPQDTDLAIGFYRRRVERQFFDKVVLGRDFYALEQRWATRPFWRVRASVAVPEPAAQDGVSRQMCPVLDQGWVREREVLVTPDHPLGVWRVADVPVVELADAMAASPDFSPDLHASRHGYQPAAVARAAAWLAQLGP